MPGAQQMDPSVWGPHLWFYLHTLPSSARDPASIRRCIENLAIPCASCDKSFREFLHSNPTDSIKSTDSAHAYINSLHNFVNRKLGKREVSLEECKGMWCAESRASAPSEGKDILDSVFNNQ